MPVVHFAVEVHIMMDKTVTSCGPNFNRDFCWTRHAVEHLVAEGHEFSSRWGQFIIDWILPVCNINYYLGHPVGRCVGLTTLPPSCVKCLEILGASTSWSPTGLSRSVKGSFTFTYYLQGDTQSNIEYVCKQTGCTKFLWLDFIFH